MRKIKFLALMAFLGLSVTVFGQKLKIPKIKDVVHTLPSPTGGTTSLTEAEIVEGLKEALIKGSSKASDSLHKVNAFNLNPKIRIPFPQDAKKVADRLRELGYGKKVDAFEQQLNKAAEESAKEAGQIFMTSIKQMSISDAKGILTGPDTAATSYLKKIDHQTTFRCF